MQSKSNHIAHRLGLLIGILGIISIYVELVPFAIHALDIDSLSGFPNLRSNRLSILVLLLSCWLMLFGRFLQTDKVRALRYLSLVFFGGSFIYILSRTIFSIEQFEIWSMHLLFPQRRFAQSLFLLGAALCLWILPEAVLSRSKKELRLASILLVVVALAFLGWHLVAEVAALPDYTVDDSYITYVYGRNLAEGHGLRYNPTDADPTTGFSSLTHVLFIALAHLFELDPLVVTRWLSILVFLSIPVAFALTFSALLGVRISVCLLAALFMQIVFSLLPESRLHLASGMETILFVGIHSWSFAWATSYAMNEAKPKPVTSLVGIILLSLLIISRPEGLPLATGYLVAICGVRFLQNRDKGYSETMIELIPVFSGLLIFVCLYYFSKLSYFGYLLPNAYFVKSHHAIFGSSGDLLPGIGPMKLFLVKRYLPFLLITLSMAFLFLPKRKIHRMNILLLPSLVITLLYVRAIHEVAFGFRYEYPYLFPLAGYMIFCIAHFWSRSPRWFLRIAALAFSLILIYSFRDAKGPSHIPNWRRYSVTAVTRWTTYTPTRSAHARMGLDLAKTGLGQNASILLSGAGMVPYYSRFFAIDWVGLNNNQLSGRWPLTIDEVWEYIDSFRPDVIYSVLPPASPGAADRSQDPVFATPVVQFWLDAPTLCQYWDRNRIEEMYYREMSYVRDHYELGRTYSMGSFGDLIAYVRRDSPYNKKIMTALNEAHQTGS